MIDVTPSEADVRRIAAEAGIDPRTVRRVLGGAMCPRSYATYDAIRTALARLGLAYSMPEWSA